MHPNAGRCAYRTLPALTPAQAETAARLEEAVRILALEHPERNTFNPMRTAAAVAYLRGRLEDTGLSTTETTVSFGAAADACTNLAVTAPGERATPVIVVGAHYDAYCETPGADDNASGVAAILELAARFAATPAPLPIRFELYGNEEPPHFMTERMGSHIAAQAARERDDDIRAMLSLEMLGYFDDTEGSQKYPPPLSSFYPSRGDFIAIVGNMRSRALVRSAVGAWRSNTPFPVYGCALPESIPGIGYSDHRSYWQAGYRAAMITDTSFYRNPHYHTRADTPDTLDYPRFARVVDAIEHTIRALAEDEARFLTPRRPFRARPRCSTPAPG